MAHIELDEAQAWAEQHKLPLVALVPELEEATAVRALSRLATAFDVTSWDDPTSTPDIVRKIIAMQYVSVFIQKAMSSEEELNEYAIWLYGNAEMLIDGLIEGSLVIDPEDPIPEDPSTPLYYPTDASSAQEATFDDPSLGPAKFTMGVIW